MAVLGVGLLISYHFPMLHWAAANWQEDEQQNESYCRVKGLELRYHAGEVNGKEWKWNANWVIKL